VTLLAEKSIICAV